MRILLCSSTLRSRVISEAPVKRTAVERQVNRQILYLFVFLLILSLVSTIGSSIREVGLTAPSTCGADDLQWVFSKQDWYLRGDVSGNKGETGSRARLRGPLTNINSEAICRGYPHLYYPVQQSHPHFVSTPTASFPDLVQPHHDN